MLNYLEAQSDQAWCRQTAADSASTRFAHGKKSACINKSGQLNTIQIAEMACTCKDLKALSGLQLVGFMPQRRASVRPAVWCKEVASTITPRLFISHVAQDGGVRLQARLIFWESRVTCREVALAFSPHHPEPAQHMQMLKVKMETQHLRWVVVALL